MVLTVCCIFVDELADLEGSLLMSELDVNSYDWEF